MSANIRDINQDRYTPPDEVWSILECLSSDVKCDSKIPADVMDALKYQARISNLTLSRLVCMVLVQHALCLRGSSGPKPIGGKTDRRMHGVVIAMGDARRNERAA